MTVLISLVLSLVLSIIPHATAWGSLGHRTVAYVAEKHLNTDGAAFVNNLLDGEDTSDAALWPDEIRRTRGWTYTAAWHFIDAEDDPPRTCKVVYNRDCLPKTGCIVSAITNMTSRILDPDLDQNSHYEALKFLLHFLGDIHQPLHTEAENRGGNGIPVLFGNRHTNLHSIWDTEIPEKHAGGAKADEKADAASWADALDGGSSNSASFLPNPVKRIARRDNMRMRAVVADECTNIQDATGCALTWATEANSYVCSYVLKDDVEGVEGRNLATDYYDGAVPIVEYLIEKAGVRLAGWLNALAAAAQQQAKLVVQGEEGWEEHEGLL
ncbi:hypothetical protein MMC07_002523 [Pseudocyphellaria aurata]|nr:hypothetical protein [Pseudocyphellaria aurata]